MSAWGREADVLTSPLFFPPPQRLCLDREKLLANSALSHQRPMRMRRDTEHGDWMREARARWVLREGGRGEEAPLCACGKQPARMPEAPSRFVVCARVLKKNKPPSNLNGEWVERGVGRMRRRLQK